MDEQPRDPSHAPEPTPPATGWRPPEPEPEPPVGWIPPADGKRSRILVRIGAGIAVAVFGLLVVGIFLGSQSDPYDQAAEELGQRLIDMPEFEARYGDVDSPNEAYQLGQHLGMTAWARLADDDLLRYWQLISNVLQIADERECAAVIRGTISASDTTALVRRLKIDEFREALDVTYVAFAAELKGTFVASAPSVADLQAASIALGAAMGAEDMLELEAAMRDTTADETAVCAAARSFLDGVLDLEDPHRATFLRYMVTRSL